MFTSRAENVDKLFYTKRMWLVQWSNAFLKKNHSFVVIKCFLFVWFVIFFFSCSPSWYQSAATPGLQLTSRIHIMRQILTTKCLSKFECSLSIFIFTKYLFLLLIPLTFAEDFWHSNPNRVGKLTCRNTWKQKPTLAIT